MSENKVKILQNQRNSVYKKLKKLYDIAAKANLEGASEKTKNEFLIRYESLFDNVAKFESLHLDIIGLTEDDQIEEQEKIQDTFNDLHYAIKLIYRDLFEIQAKVKLNSNSANSGASIKSDRCDRIRLPKIEIPKFDGDFKKWPTFLTCSGH